MELDTPTALTSASIPHWATLSATIAATLATTSATSEAIGPASLRSTSSVDFAPAAKSSISEAITVKVADSIAPGPVVGPAAAAFGTTASTAAVDPFASSSSSTAVVIVANTFRVIVALGSRLGLFLGSDSFGFVRS